MKIISVMPDHGGTRFYTKGEITSAMACEIRSKLSEIFCCIVCVGPNEDESGSYIMIFHDTLTTDDFIKSEIERLIYN